MLLIVIASYCAKEEEFVVKPDLSDSCKVFFNCGNACLADQELSEQIRVIGIREALYAHEIPQAILEGHFTYNVGGSPISFLGFYFNKESPIQNNDLDRMMVLHLVATQGQGKIVDEIKASAKQTVLALMNFSDLVMQIKLLMGTCIIFS